MVETLLYEASRYCGTLRDLNADLAARWMQQALARLHKAANESECELDDFAATALLAVLGEGRAVFVQLGDGGWVVENDAGFEAVTWPQTGEYANITVFVTSAGALNQIQFKVVESSVLAVAGFTDGIQTLCLDLAAKRPHGPFFARVLAPLRTCEDATELNGPLMGLLDSTLFNDRTDDDKTLVLACRNASVILPNLAVFDDDADQLGG